MAHAAKALVVRFWDLAKVRLAPPTQFALYDYLTCIVYRRRLSMLILMGYLLMHFGCSSNALGN